MWSISQPLHRNYRLKSVLQQAKQWGPPWRQNQPALGETCRDRTLCFFGSIQTTVDLIISAVATFCAADPLKPKANAHLVCLGLIRRSLYPLCCAVRQTESGWRADCCGWLTHPAQPYFHSHHTHDGIAARSVDHTTTNLYHLHRISLASHPATNL